jgi:hypothetical protein
LKIFLSVRSSRFNFIQRRNYDASSYAVADDSGDENALHPESQMKEQVPPPLSPNNGVYTWSAYDTTDAFHEASFWKKIKLLNNGSGCYGDYCWFQEQVISS